MDAPHVVRASQIGDGARDAQHAGVATRRHTRRFGGLREQAAAGFVGGCDRVEQRAVRLGVGPRRLPRIACALDRAGGRDARGDLGRSFLGRRQDEVGGADRSNLDMQVDAVTHNYPFQERTVETATGSPLMNAASDSGVVSLKPSATMACCHLTTAAIMPGWL
ncbi:hypothetical protein WR25_15785 [Diploscapter pachys]|uniref:Uncharacterized protein n=1 Tax=Diploscapter pachys TaxID=2018661 RepID=A0A2A2JXM0_9BILA|nr:hypothetical protein WR25_15785 [Diploscapter pachys]